MRVVTITPPAPLVTWEEAERHLKLDGDTTDQTLVEAYIAAASAHIDGPDGSLGRAIGTQTLEARLWGFGGGCVRLDFPEVQSITSIKYVDAAGAEQTVAADQYQLAGREIDLAYGVSWPAARWQRDAVRIRYVAGYAPGAPQLAVAKAAVLLMVGDLYRNRATVAQGQVSAIPMSTTVENLLQPLLVLG